MNFEIEFAPGLIPIVKKELEQLLGSRGRIAAQHRAGELTFSYSGNPADLGQLQTVIAVYGVKEFAVPRPKALLGHENLHKLINHIQAVMGSDTRQVYRSLYLSAAGSESSVMNRIKEELASALGLQLAADEGDLLLRLRPTPKRRGSWDVLVRFGVRPLATRDWRVCNMQGALNASVANALTRLTLPDPRDTFLNIACGSGTIMIERLALMRARYVIGCDNNPTALRCAAANIAQSRLEHLQLLQSDGIMLPLADNCVDALCADLPFGQLVGSHEENEWLYPALLAEAARIARPAARFILLTHEIRLMEQVLGMIDRWRVVDKLRITLSGLHPGIYVLERQ